MIIKNNRISLINLWNLLVKKSLDQLDYIFDIIISSAILEHIPELDKVLRKLFNFVSSGGYFYVRVPYIMPFKKIFKNIPLFINWK